MSVPQTTTRFIKDGNVTLTKLASAAYASAATPSVLVIRDASGRAQFADPAASGDAATKNYVDTIATGLLSYKNTVRAIATTPLPANTYSNGASGVGATLTATSNGALTAIDGVTLALNDRVAIAGEATASHNGLYALTQLGTGGSPFILTRVTDADTATELASGMFFDTSNEGTTYKNTIWLLATTNPVVVGTTSLTFLELPSLNDLVAGTGLSKTGFTLNLANTAVTAAAYSGLPSFTVDAQGRLTLATNRTIQHSVFTAAGGETSITTGIANCLAGSGKVWINGHKLTDGTHYTFTAATGAFTALDALDVGDFVEWEVIAP